MYVSKVMWQIAMALETATKALVTDFSELEIENIFANIIEWSRNFQPEDGMDLELDVDQAWHILRSKVKHLVLHHSSKSVTTVSSRLSQALKDLSSVLEL